MSLDTLEHFRELRSITSNLHEANAIAAKIYADRREAAYRARKAGLEVSEIAKACDCSVRAAASISCPPGSAEGLDDGLVASPAEAPRLLHPMALKSRAKPRPAKLNS